MYLEDPELSYLTLVACLLSVFIVHVLGLILLNFEGDFYLLILSCDRVSMLISLKQNTTLTLHIACSVCRLCDYATSSKSDHSARSYI